MSQSDEMSFAPAESSVSSPPSSEASSTTPLAPMRSARTPPASCEVR